MISLYELVKHEAVRSMEAVNCIESYIIGYTIGTKLQKDGKQTVQFRNGGRENGQNNYSSDTGERKQHTSAK